MANKTLYLKAHAKYCNKHVMPIIMINSLREET